MDKVAKFEAQFLKTSLPEFRSGDTVKVYQKVKEGDKVRIQIFEGLVISRKHGKGVNGTFTVRKVTAGVGVEKTYPLHSPWIDKIELVRRTKARRNKLYFVRHAKGKRARMKGILAELPTAVVAPEIDEEVKEGETREQETASSV